MTKFINNVFLVKIVQNGSVNSSEFLQYVFEDYSDARKIAKAWVDKMNKEIYHMHIMNETNKEQMLEVSPDLWTNGKDSVDVIVFPYSKQNASKFKMKRIKKLNQAKKNEITAEDKAIARIEDNVIMFQGSKNLRKPENELFPNRSKIRKQA